jgi:hypothetical protein
MTSSCGELLRRRMEAMTKVIAPRPLGDASMVTQKRKFAACQGLVRAQNDGQLLVYSADSVLLARGGCAVCNDRPQVTTTQDNCGCAVVEDLAKKPLAYQGKMSCPCPTHTPANPALVAVPECCPAPGYTNTYLANHIRVNPESPYPLPPCKPVARCPRPGPEIANPCCTEDGSSREGFNSLYFDTTILINQGAEAPPCSSC